MVALHFGGKERHLKFDISAIKDLERICDGQPLGVVLGKWMNLGITEIVAGLYAGLKHEDQALTLGLVTKYLQTYIRDDKKSIRAIGRALSEALDESGLLRSEDEAREGNEQTTETVPA